MVSGTFSQKIGTGCKTNLRGSPVNILVLSQRAWPSDALGQSSETKLNEQLGKTLYALLAEHPAEHPAEHNVTIVPFPLAIDTGDFDPAPLRDVDLILLDLSTTVPATDSLFANFAVLRQTTRLPILLVAHTVDEATLVRFYAIGLDDHLPPPHSAPLLAAKLRAWERWVERVASALLN
jgi:CheY-like chemotaxis protein